MDSTLAPSEKHLEDWIISLGNFNHVIEKALDMEFGILPNDCKLVGRQYPVSSGYIDLLYSNPLWFEVVELKRHAIDAAALHQALRYAGDIITTECDEIIGNYANTVFPDTFDTSRISSVSSVLIGHSVDNNTLLACLGANVQVLTYKYIDGEYSLKYEYPSSITTPSLIPYIKNMYSNWARRYGVQRFITNPDMTQ